jgi:hypothetical protein
MMATLCYMMTDCTRDWEQSDIMWEPMKFREKSWGQNSLIWNWCESLYMMILEFLHHVSMAIPIASLVLLKWTRRHFS